MVKERRINRERGLKRKSRYMSLSSDDSDEDYVVEHEENTSEEDELEIVEAPLEERNSRNKNAASKNACHLIDSDDDIKTEEENSKEDDDDASIEEEIEEEEELDDELFDEDEEDDDEFIIEEEEDEDAILEEDDDADDENYTSKTKIGSKMGHKKTSRKLNRKALCTRPKKRSGKKSRKNGYKVKGTCLSKSNKVKNKSSQGRKRCRNDSNSESDSDFDYTISEEEREQVKEANKFCGGLITNTRILPSRILPSKKKTEENGTVKSKGKEKETANEGKFVCGICLSEEDKRRSKGTLSCCTHIYCFTCIMEWAKVESRCPLCKQRFKTITKHGRSANGVDLRNVVIDVPERDQVYQPTEEEIRSFVDPYENVICTECHEGGDDGLMLLCDICDSPAHTYCVGLGWQVPEGNWYCDVCRPGSHEPPNSSQDQRPPQNNGESSGPEFWPPSSRHQGIALSSPSATGAATLSGRRQILRHIHHLISIRQGPIPSRGDSNDLVEGPSSTQQSTDPPCLSLFSCETPSTNEQPCVLDERASDELQSTVVNHLISLSKDSRLGDDVFKEIVRSSVHTVLATCGAEHCRSEVQVVPPPAVCVHFDRVQSGDRSLVKGLCSSCFDSFVKDVVKRILDTRLPHWLRLSL